MLHTINKSPFQSDSFTSCLRFIQPGDPILLIEDGVYAAAPGKYAQTLKEVQAKNPVFALAGDLAARGITNLVDGVQTVDYEGFVELVEQHQVNSWL